MCKTDKILSIFQVWKRYQFVIIAVLFFSLSPILSYDTGHYLQYGEILSGNELFASWDIARGLSFPLLIHYSELIFGDTVNSLLAWMFIFYTLSYVLFKKIIYMFFEESIKTELMIIILFIFDTLIFSWYHVLLTEFIASTFGLASVYVSLRLGKMKYSDAKIKFIFFLLYFIFALSFMYHIKQPYVLVVLIPLVSTVFSFIIIKEYRDTDTIGLRFLMLTIGLRFLMLLISIAVLLSSMVMWNNFLVHSNNKMTDGRSANYFLSKMLLVGVKFIGDSNVSKIHDSNFPINEIKNHPKLSGHDKRYLLSIIDSGYSVKNSLAYVSYIAKNYPSQLIDGYASNYLAIINISNHGMYENKAIAYRYFNENITNTFYMPPYEKYISNYKQQMGDSTLIIKFWKVLSIKSDYLFRILLALAPFVILVTTYLLFIKNVEKYRNFIYLLFMINSLIFIHILSHAILGAVIDRYAFPVYPLGIMSFVVLLNLIFSEVKKMYLVEKEVQ